MARAWDYNAVLMRRRSNTKTPAPASERSKKRIDWKWKWKGKLNRYLKQIHTHTLLRSSRHLIFSSNIRLWILFHWHWHCGRCWCTPKWMFNGFWNAVNMFKKNSYHYYCHYIIIIGIKICIYSRLFFFIDSFENDYAWWKYAAVFA